MKRIPLILFLAGLATGGCAVHEATVQGHDLVLAGLDEIDKGIDEYQADDLVMNRKIRDKLAAALAEEVVKNANDEQIVKEKAAKFLQLLDQNDADRMKGEERYRALKDNLRAIRETTHKLRDLEEIKLGWRDDVLGYIRALRAVKEKK
jgi:hypothetical protein